MNKKLKPIEEVAKNRKELENLALKLKSRSNDKEDLGGVLSTSDKKKLIQKSDDTLEWLEKNPKAENWKIKDKISELKDETDNIIEKGQAKKDLTEKIEDLQNKSKDTLSKSDKKEFDNKLKEYEDKLDKNLNASEIEELSNDLDKKLEDQIKKIELKKKADEVANKLTERLKDSDDPLSTLTSSDKKLLKSEISDLLDFIEDDKKNPSAAEIENKLKNFENKTNPIVEKATLRGGMEKSANELKSRLKDKIDLGSLNTEDKENLTKYGVDEVNDWLDKNPNASNEETEKKKERFWW